MNYQGLFFFFLYWLILLCTLIENAELHNVLTILWSWFAIKNNQQIGVSLERLPPFIQMFKVALYTKGSTIYKPTSQYGDLNTLWKCF